MQWSIAFIMPSSINDDQLSLSLPNEVWDVTPIRTAPYDLVADLLIDLHHKVFSKKGK